MLTKKVFPTAKKMCSEEEFFLLRKYNKKGKATIYPPFPTNSRYGAMALLYTPLQHRRRGLAQLAVSALSRRLISLGVRRPFVLSEETNPESNALFKKMGFRETGVRMKFVGFRPSAGGVEGRTEADRIILEG